MIPLAFMKLKACNFYIHFYHISRYNSHKTIIFLNPPPPFLIANLLKHLAILLAFTGLILKLRGKIPAGMQGKMGREQYLAIAATEVTTAKLKKWLECFSPFFPLLFI